MRFTLIRSGGVAGISPPPLSVSTESLPTDEATRLRTLVDAAGFFELAPNLGPADASPDSFGYELTVEEDVGSHRRNTVTFGAASAPPSLRELVSAVRAVARRQGSGAAPAGGAGPAR